MTRRIYQCTLLLAFVLVMLMPNVTDAAQAIEARHDREGDRELLVLENTRARVAVWPEAGGAIVEYLDKVSGIDFVAGTVEPGAARFGWKDVTRLRPQGPMSNVFGAQPYDGRFVEVDGQPAIEVTCTLEHLRIERTMHLSSDSPELIVRVKTTNVSDEPQTIWARWHPYMEIGDDYAEHSAIVLPEGPQELTHPAAWRKVFVGQGWDQSLIVKHGYWLAADYRHGRGIWMTFDTQDVPTVGTWTDYRFTDHPARGQFVAELYPKPRRTIPGESVVLRLAYLPFTSEDDADTMSLGVLEDEDERAAARIFLRRVKPNLRAIGPHTMQPQPNNQATAESENRFYFLHRRRDRAGLTDWGFADAMLAVGARQSQPVRMRHYARVFDNHRRTVSLDFRLTVTNPLGESVQSHVARYEIDPEVNREIDERVEVAIDDLPDGRYTFTLSVHERGDDQPLHRHTEQRRLIDRQWTETVEQRKRDADLTLRERERSFVRALRRIDVLTSANEGGVVPIGIEEGGGIARTAWPMTLGVPLHQGVLTDANAVVMRDPAGQSVPVQTHVQGTWPDGSIKWLKADFQANVPADSHVFYMLHLNEANDAGPLPDLVRRDGDAMIIDTGVRTSDFKRDIFAMMRDGLWWTTGDGQRHTFQLRGDDAGVEIEHNGPQRAVIKVTGWYVHEQRTQPVAMAELRFEFYRNKSWFRLMHQVTYTGNPWRDTLESYGIEIQLPTSFDRAIYELDGNEHASDRAMSLQQITEDIARVKFADDALVKSARTAGGVKLQGATDASVHLRDAWKLYPKQIDADPGAGTVTLHYWPRFAGTMSFQPREDTWLPSSSSMEALAIGASRTMELVIDPAGSFAPAAVHATFAEPVIAVVPPRHVAATDTLPHLQPYDPDKIPELEKIIDEMLESYRLNQRLHGWYGHWQWGSFPNVFLEHESRWAEFGRYGHVLNEQNVAHALWLAYFRSGDREHFKLARAFSRHLMEVGTIRWSEHWPQWVGMSRRHHESIWLSGGDYGHSMLDPFLEDYHATGYRPAWEAAERMAEGMRHQKGGTWRYISNPIAGLARLYDETHEPRYKAYADKLWRTLAYPDRNRWHHGDHGSRMAIQYARINDEFKALWLEIADEHESRFDTFDSLATLYAETGDAKWAQRAADQMTRIPARLQRHDQNRDDSTRWSIAALTQHALAHLRELCYASEVIAVGQGVSSDELDE